MAKLKSNPELTPQDNAHFKFRIGALVEYTGENKGLKKKLFKVKSHKVEKRAFRKDQYVYVLVVEGSKNIETHIIEDVLKAHKPSYSIIEVGKMAKKIQHESGVKEVVRVKHYNISRSKATQKALEKIKAL